ncbi:MAG: glycosyltransferase family 2 protein [Gemmataceae bacterium]|nr:glycosyltransferase family 2 protein [Gemmata sp.]MDW8198865.1 glycosyltransferase family 2 protein [Gemmataceae bacterium]
MSKHAARDGLSVVIPAHNAAAALDRVLPAWGAVLPTLQRPFEIIVVDDGSTDTTPAVLGRRLATVPHLRVLQHSTRQGFGACLRTALPEVKYPLLLYAGVDYPYTPTDIRPMLERIELRDEIFGRPPDLISGMRAGRQRPWIVKWLGRVWNLFWRLFAGLPLSEPMPWYGWRSWWNRLWTRWIYGVPLADVNSAFKLWRTAFLRRFPIQSDGDFVHTELVAKATFLTSIMDEMPLSWKADPLPPLFLVPQDRRRVFSQPQFTHESETPRDGVSTTAASAPVANGESSSSPVPTT